ncbi:hypothetical protein HG263_12540 [Pseudoalteromonas sp. JBTF-M23]|uniref:Uncharacterized protein n=1 Tax=Pseudoalteromonas caenipelagi TaxID=2726988 RepID=A0A849VI57_9GAMM|nr:hypothetical protein [Pseudoalteromonas caenipelagi]NOU51357.1 hypothetical protein [Pseudoalteromonas caenipelagi]
MNTQAINTLRLMSLSTELLATGHTRGTCMNYVSDVVPSLLSVNQVSAPSIDLILTLSMSIDHLTDDTAIQSPRLGYPIQHYLAASNAFVLDLQDTSWAQAFEVANGYLSCTDMQRVLVVEANSFAQPVASQLFNGARAALLDKAAVETSCMMVNKELPLEQMRTLVLTDDKGFALSEADEHESMLLCESIIQMVKQSSVAMPVVLDLPLYLQEGVYSHLQSALPQMQWLLWESLGSNQASNVLWVSYEVFRKRVVARELLIKDEL